MSYHRRGDADLGHLTTTNSDLDLATERSEHSPNSGADRHPIVQGKSISRLQYCLSSIMSEP